MSKTWRVTQTSVSHVQADEPAEAIRIARERGLLSFGAIEVTEVTGEELRRHMVPRSPSTFELQAAAVKRSPSGTMAAVRIPDTDPAPPPEDG